MAKRQGKERETSAAVQVIKGRVKVDVSLLDSCEECKGTRGSDKMVLILYPVKKQEGSQYPVVFGSKESGTVTEASVKSCWMTLVGIFCLALHEEQG